MIDEASGTFLDRLKTEREQLSAKADALTLFLQRGAPGASKDQRFLMDTQIIAMNLYLKTLDLRLQDLALQPRPIETEK